MGSKNATAYFNGYNCYPTTAADIVTMQYKTDATQIINVDGPPEGFEAANPGSLAMDRINGNLWKKQSGTGNTGWEQLSTTTGTGNVVGTPPSTDNAVARYDGATGLLIQNSLVTISDNGSIVGPGNITMTNTSPTASISFSAINADTDAGAVAQIQTLVTNLSLADPFFTASISLGTAYSWGLDNSDSDAFTLTSATTLNGSNILRATSAGAVSFQQGNVDITRSASGADVSETISNTSNTASSTATQYLTVAGTSAGDAQVQYAVAGTTTWTHGIDNSDSDNWVLAASASLGTTNVITCNTAGSVSIPTSGLTVLGNIATTGGNFSASRSSVGGTVSASIVNTDNTNAVSNAQLFLQTGGASGGDPYIQFNNNVNYNLMGIDNSDSDKFKINSNAASLGTNDAFVLTTAGEITMPLQPAFLAISTGTADATGDGTNVNPVVFATEVFDQGGDATTTVFTCPVNARVQFNAALQFSQTTAATQTYITLITSNRSYQKVINTGAAAIGASNAISISVLADMDVGDTAQVQCGVSGLTKTVDIAATDSYFSAFIAC